MSNHFLPLTPDALSLSLTRLPEQRSTRLLALLKTDSTSERVSQSFGRSLDEIHAHKLRVPLRRRGLVEAASPRGSRWPRRLPIALLSARSGHNKAELHHRYSFSC